MTLWASFLFPSLTFLLSCQVGLSSARKRTPAPWSVGSDYSVGALLLIALWTLCKNHSPTINIYLNICDVLLLIIYKDLPFLTKNSLCPKIMSIFLSQVNTLLLEYMIDLFWCSLCQANLCWSEIPVKSVGHCSCSRIHPNILTLRVKADTNFLKNQDRADWGGCQPKGCEHITAPSKVSV